MAGVQRPDLTERAPLLRRLWPIYLGYFISQLGSWMFRAGIVYDLYDKQGGSAATLGWTILLTYVPLLLGGKFLSPLADRLSSRTLLIAVDALRALLLVPLLFWGDLRHSPTTTVALAVIAALSFTSPLFTSAQSAYIRRTLAPQQVTSAMALITNIDWLANLFGALVGTLLLLVVPITYIVGIDLLTFLASIALLGLFLQRDEWNPAPRPRAAGPGNGAKHRGVGLGLVLMAIFCLNLGAGVINLYPNILAHDVYHSSSSALSYVYLGNGLGGFLGALAVVWVKKRLAPIRMTMVSSALIALSLVGMSRYYGLGYSSLMGALMLLFGQIFGVGVHSYLLTTAPAAQAGKTTGLFVFATFAGVTGNALIFTLLQGHVQLFSWFTLGCAACAVLALVFLAGYERHRHAVPSESEAIGG